MQVRVKQVQNIYSTKIQVQVAFKFLLFRWKLARSAEVDVAGEKRMLGESIAFDLILKFKAHFEQFFLPDTRTLYQPILSTAPTYYPTAISY